MDIKSNDVFGRLTVRSKAPSKNNRSMYECLCVCGNTKVVRGKDLKSGNTQSCGCLKIERQKQGGETLAKRKIESDHNRLVCCGKQSSKWGFTSSNTRQWHCNICGKFYT